MDWSPYVDDVMACEITLDEVRILVKALEAVPDKSEEEKRLLSEFKDIPMVDNL